MTINFLTDLIQFIIDDRKDNVRSFAGKKSDNNPAHNKKMPVVVLLPIRNTQTIDSPGDSNAWVIQLGAWDIAQSGLKTEDKITRLNDMYELLQSVVVTFAKLGDNEQELTVNGRTEMVSFKNTAVNYEWFLDQDDTNEFGYVATITITDATKLDECCITDLFKTL